jgi:hypothetical protein
MISLVYRAVALPFEIFVYFWYLFWVIKRALFPPVPLENGILSRIGSLAIHAVIWPLEAIVLIWHLFWIITHKIFPHTAKRPYKPTPNGTSTGPVYTYPPKIPVTPKPYPSGGGVSTGPVYPYPTGPKVPGAPTGKPYVPGGVPTGPTYPYPTPPKVSEPHKPYTPNGSGTHEPTYTLPKEVPHAPNPHAPDYGHDHGHVHVPTGPMYPGSKLPEAPKPTPPSGPGNTHPHAPQAPSSTTPSGPSDPASAEYLHGAQYIEPITLNHKGEDPLFVNIRNGKYGVTALFDGYRKEIPDSNVLRGEECDSGLKQVYWYFRRSPSFPNAYTVIQRHTGWILSYPSTPTVGSQITVEKTSNSLWEIREGSEDWILSPRGSSLALTLADDLEQITLQHASANNLSQQWWIPKSKS